MGQKKFISTNRYRNRYTYIVKLCLAIAAYIKCSLFARRMLDWYKFTMMSNVKYSKTEREEEVELSHALVSRASDHVDLTCT